LEQLVIVSGTIDLLTTRLIVTFDQAVGLAGTITKEVFLPKHYRSQDT